MGLAHLDPQLVLEPHRRVEGMVHWAVEGEAPRGRVRVSIRVRVRVGMRVRGRVRVERQAHCLGTTHTARAHLLPWDGAVAE